MKCSAIGCDRNVEPRNVGKRGKGYCPVHTFTCRPTISRRDTASKDGDGLCSGCGEQRGWLHGLCRQCLGAA